MENSDVKRLSFGASLAAKLSSLIMLVLQLYCGLIFYNGVVKAVDGAAAVGIAEGTNLVKHVGSLFKWIVGVFSGKGLLFANCLTFVHFVILVIALLNFVISFIRFFFLFFGDEDKFLRNSKNSAVICKKFIASASLMLLFILVASMKNGYEIPASANLLIICIAAGIIISRFAKCITADKPFRNLLSQIMYCVVMIAIIGMIVVVFANANLISEAEAAFGSIKSGASSKDMLPKIFEFASYVTLGLVLLNCIAMVYSSGVSKTVPNKMVKASGISVLSLTIVYIALDILCHKSFGTDYIKGYAVLLLVALASFFFGLISTKPKKNDDGDDAAEPADENADEPVSDDAADPTPDDNAAPIDEAPKSEDDGMSPPDELGMRDYTPKCERRFSNDKPEKKPKKSKNKSKDEPVSNPELKKEPEPDEEQAPAPTPAPVPAPMPEPAPEEEPAEDSIPAPVQIPKVLVIGKGVKKIKSEKYRGRTDIGVIVIPKNVVYIEAYAFFGCNALKEIHCERATKPRFWHEEWNYGCSAKVIWDSTNENSIEE